MFRNLTRVSGRIEYNYQNMEIIKCDKCKKRKPSTEKSLLKTRWISGSIHGGNPYFWLSFDLCEKCSKKLIKFVKNYLARKI